MITTFRGNYLFLSNFYESPVCYDGLIYRNVEAAFQSAKLTDIDSRKQFTELDGRAAKKLGRIIPLRPDWEQVKYSIMLDIVRSKFTDCRLRQSLVATATEEIAEHNSWGDTTWGVCNGVGNNWLGKILMTVRNEILNNERSVVMSNLITGSFSDIGKVECDEIWCIVRSLRKLPKANVPVKHVPELSPSTELFKDYLRWRDAGEWNMEKFEDEYKPRFLCEMRADNGMKFLKLLHESCKSKRIMIVCYCKDEAVCHRSLVRSIIEQMDEVDEAIRKVNHKFYCLVAGSRNWSNYEVMRERLDYFLQNHEQVIIVSGGARGADALAERYARERGYGLKVFPAQWDTYGKRAGYLRNEEMHKYISAHEKRGVICFWDGVSKGTAHNFELAKKYNNPLRIIKPANYPPSRPIKIGVTEQGDAALDFSWFNKLEMGEVNGAVLITKNLSTHFIGKVMEAFSKGYKIVVHCTCTGLGGSIIEPYVPLYTNQLKMLKNLIDCGFPRENCVLRIDPIIPTKNGLEAVNNVLSLAFDLGILPSVKVRVSILDEYLHVKARLRNMPGCAPFYDGDRFQANEEEMRAVINILAGYNIKYYTCAEPLLIKLAPELFIEEGCVSSSDAKVFGLDLKSENLNPQGRRGCKCLGCKTELLTSGRHRCLHQCAYCYWH